MTDRIVDVLATGAIPSNAALGEGFRLHSGDEIADSVARGVRAVAAAGSRKITGPFMDRFPALEIIANFGVGYDRIDVAAATSRGITVTNTPDVLTDEVADFTIGLMLATVRRIVAADRFLRSGAWAEGAAFPLSASLRNRRIGLLGMGRIGQAIARRCAAMGLEVAYCSRTRHADLPYSYHSEPVSLASAVEVLIVIVPASPATDGLVSRDVIAALGASGVLVNVARGSVVDEGALIGALESGALLAAGLDVFPDEPRVAPRLVALPNVVLTPHIGSATGATRAAMGDLVLANIRNWFAGKGALTPVNAPTNAPMPG